MPDVIGDFADRLLKEKSLENLDPAVLVEMKKDLVTRLNEYINLAVLSSVAPEYYTELDKIILTNNQVKIQEFLQANVPNFQDVIAQALLKFRVTYLGL